jgi:cytochrome c oxidase cbb3-type subunit 3
MNDQSSAMSAAEQATEAPLTDHMYDGIQEYDNPLPGWWVWLFGLSVVFAFFYWTFFESGVEGRSVEDQYDRNAAAVFETRFKEIGELPLDRPTLVKYLNEPKWLKVGEVTFKANCVSCHGQNAQGGIGPNLTDDNWKNVKNIEDIATVIQNGAAKGAMPAWRNRLSHQNQIVLTAAYIASLRGSNPPGGKAAEGSAIPPWPSE